MFPRISEWFVVCLALLLVPANATAQAAPARAGASAKPVAQKAIPANSLLVADSDGSLTPLLREAKYNPIAWSASLATSAKPTVTPRLLVASLSSLKPVDYSALDRFVRQGGRALLISVDGTGIVQNFGIDVKPVENHRLQPVDEHHPVFRGMTFEETGDQWGTAEQPMVAMSRPVSGGWLPLLLTENQEASALMENRVGRGRLILATLDLRLKGSGASLWMRNLLDYLASPVLVRSTKTLYIGPPTYRALLDRAGIRYQVSARFTPDARLVIIAPEARKGGNRLIENEFLARGGRVLVLPTRSGDPDISNRLFTGPARLPGLPECLGIVAGDLRTTRPLKMNLLASKDASAGGLFLRQAVGNGVLVASQIDPVAVSAVDRKAGEHYLRAVSTLLANMGAAFTKPVIRSASASPVTVAVRAASVKKPVRAAVPRKAVRPAPQQPQPTPATPEPIIELREVPVAKGWRVRLTDRVDGNDPARPDPGISLHAKALVEPDIFDEDWDLYDAPGSFPALSTDDGEAVFHRSVDLPAGWVGRELELSLGKIADNDTTYFNGVMVGSTKGKDGLRVYRIPAELVQAGKNLIAVRVFDRGPEGGFVGPAEAMVLRLKPPPDNRTLQ